MLQDCEKFIDTIKDCKRLEKQPMQETIKDCKNLEKQS